MRETNRETKGWTQSVIFHLSQPIAESKSKFMTSSSVSRFSVKISIHRSPRFHTLYFFYFSLHTCRYLVPRFPHRETLFPPFPRSWLVNRLAKDRTLRFRRAPSIVKSILSISVNGQRRCGQWIWKNILCRRAYEITGLKRKQLLARPIYRVSVKKRIDRN